MCDDPRTLLKSAAAQPAGEFDVDDLRARGTRVAHRRLLAFVAGITAALLLVAVGVVATLQTVNDPNHVEIVGQPVELSEATWQQMPSGPVDGRVFPSVVWTGDRLLVWGGERPAEEQWHNTGAVFDPDTMNWTPMAETSISPRSEHAAVWTGEEMIVCCGRLRGPDGAGAYDPHADQWRTIPTSPMRNVEFPVAVWTGEEMIVTGGVTGGGTGDVRTTAAFDPETDRWRTLPDVPAVLERRASASWTGEHMIVWPSDGRAAWALDPHAERWIELPPAPARPISASTVWTGKEFVVVGASLATKVGTEEKLVGAAYRPDRDSWRTLKPGLPPAQSYNGNVGGQAAVWTGRQLIVWTGHLGSGVTTDGSVVMSYDPANGSWQQLSTAPRTMWSPHLAWTGNHLMAIGQEDSLILATAAGTGATVGDRPPPEPAPSTSVDLQTLFGNLPGSQLPEAGSLAGGGPRIAGHGVLLPPGGPLTLNVPDAAHDVDGTLAFTVWQVDDDGNRMNQVRTAGANAGPQGARAIEVDVSTDEGAKYEVIGELRQVDGDTAVWRDWAVVAPQIASASLEVFDTAVVSNQEFQVAVRNRGTVALTYGQFYELYRWDGDTWVQQQGAGEGFKAIGLTVPPGQLGDTQTVTAPSETGYYRIVKQLDAGTTGEQLEVAAQFQVVPQR